MVGRIIRHSEHFLHLCKKLIQLPIGKESYASINVHPMKLLKKTNLQS
jgi:hypothetical protein